MDVMGIFVVFLMCSFGALIIWAYVIAPISKKRDDEENAKYKELTHDFLDALLTQRPEDEAISPYQKRQKILQLSQQLKSCAKLLKKQRLKGFEDRWDEEDACYKRIDELELWLYPSKRQKEKIEENDAIKADGKIIPLGKAKIVKPETQGDTVKSKSIYHVIGAIILIGAGVGLCFLTIWGFCQSAKQEGERIGYDLGYSDGYDLGYEEGYDVGYDAGDSNGYDLGYKNGEDNGYDTGYSDGRSDAFEYINEWLYNHYGDGADEYYSQTVYVTDTGDKYHREGCSYLLSSNPITLRQAINRGYTPCSRCNPPT